MSKNELPQRAKRLHAFIQRCTDVGATLFKRCVPAGQKSDETEMSDESNLIWGRTYNSGRLTQKATTRAVCIINNTCTWQLCWLKIVTWKVVWCEWLYPSTYWRVTYWFWRRSRWHRRRRRRDTFLSAQYIANQSLDSYQIFLDI